MSGMLRAETRGVIAGHLNRRWRMIKPIRWSDDVGMLLAISIGLGCLYNEDEDAERAWMSAPHPDLGGAQPVQAVMSGRAREVLDIVHKERGL
jgi:uncharacterized protein (DUF2384 family)